jgi:hypothetical protein
MVFKCNNLGLAVSNIASLRRVLPVEFKSYLAKSVANNCFFFGVQPYKIKTVLHGIYASNTSKVKSTTSQEVKYLCQIFVPSRLLEKSLLV